MKKLILILALIFSAAHAEAWTGHSNFSFGTLTISIPISAGTGSTFTILPGTTALAFPASNFEVVVSTCSQPSTCANKEIILISSRTGNTFTIAARNQGGTTHSIVWPIGANIGCVITSEKLSEIESAIDDKTLDRADFISDVFDTNTALGYSALYNYLDGNGGDNNTAIGYRAMLNTHHIIGSNAYLNTAVGSDSLLNNTTGSFNVGAGTRTLLNNSTGDYNVALGYGAGYYETGSNKLYIDSRVTPTVNPLIGGDFEARTVQINGDITVDSSHAYYGDGSHLTGISAVPGGGSTNHATCWKAGGALGYCSSAIDSFGTCTCN